MNNREQRIRELIRQPWVIRFVSTLFLFGVIMSLQSQCRFVFAQTSQPTQPSFITSDTASENIPDIAPWHLFGINQTEALPKTRLPIRLTGIFFDANSQTSQAIIATGDAPGHIYHRGDQLQDGAIIERIMPTQVLLREHDHLVSLPLIRATLQ